MTTGMSDYGQSISRAKQTIAFRYTLIMRSGLKVPAPTIPMPDLAVPYAAPAPEYHRQRYPVVIQMLSGPLSYIQISLRTLHRPARVVSQGPGNRSYISSPIRRRGRTSATTRLVPTLLIQLAVQQKVGRELCGVVVSGTRGVAMVRLRVW